MTHAEHALTRRASSAPLSFSFPFPLSADITNYETFANLQRWVDKVTLEAEKNCSMILVGNKLDIVEANPSLRRVPLEEAKRYGASVNAMVVEASAKSGGAITNTFEQVVSIYLERAEATKSAAPASQAGSVKVQGGGAATGGRKCC